MAKQTGRAPIEAVRCYKCGNIALKNTAFAVQTENAEGIKRDEWLCAPDAKVAKVGAKKGKGSEVRACMMCGGVFSLSDVTPIKVTTTTPPQTFFLCDDDLAKTRAPSEPTQEKPAKAAR